MKAKGALEVVAGGAMQLVMERLDQEMAVVEVDKVRGQYASQAAITAGWDGCSMERV